jgi:hypothetical protein
MSLLEFSRYYCRLSIAPMGSFGKLIASIRGVNESRDRANVVLVSG